MSLSEAADAILGTSENDTKNSSNQHNSSMMGSHGHGGNFDTSPGAVAKNLLGKITMRKASIFRSSSSHVLTNSETTNLFHEIVTVVVK